MGIGTHPWTPRRGPFIQIKHLHKCISQRRRHSCWHGTMHKKINTNKQILNLHGLKMYKTKSNNWIVFSSKYPDNSLQASLLCVHGGIFEEPYGNLFVPQGFFVQLATGKKWQQGSLVTPYPAFFFNTSIVFAICCCILCCAKVQGDWKVTALKTKAGPGQLCLFRKLEISAAIEVTDWHLSTTLLSHPSQHIMVIAWKVKSQSHRGTCTSLKSVQVLGRNYVRWQTKKNAHTLHAHSQFFSLSYVDMTDSVSTTDGCLLTKVTPTYTEWKEQLGKSEQHRCFLSVTVCTTASNRLLIAALSLSILSV